MQEKILKSLSADCGVISYLRPIFVLSVCLGTLGSPLFVNAQLKFVSLGNWGFDSGNQHMVAERLKSFSPQEKISFIVSPGSNFLGGINSTVDETWQTAFEDVYSDPSGSLKMPFFTVLGVEDWSRNYTAQILETEVAYKKREESNFPIWTAPNWWYWHTTSFSASTGPTVLHSGHKDMSVGIIFIDTYVLSSSFPYASVTDQAWADLESTLKSAPSVLDYIIVVGDKSIYSSGPSRGDGYLSSYLLPMLKDAGVDAYISGYDFNMEEIEDEGLTHITCGSASMGGGSPVIMSGGSKYYTPKTGFCVHELTADGMITKFIDGSSGEVLYESKWPLKQRSGKFEYTQQNFISLLPKVQFWPVPEMGKMPGKDIFVRIVGTIGLTVAAIFGFLTIASATSKIVR